MSKKQYNRDEALAVANEVQAWLAPACSQIAIVGSLRRGKPTVSDCELLFVPLMGERRDGLFDTRIVDVCSEVCEGLLKSGLLAKRPNVNGHFAWGEKNKLAVHVPSGIPLDLFSTSSQNWPVSLVIRTGSRETNLRLTNGAIARGASLNAYGMGITESDGTIVPATSERHVFELCNIPYLEPTQR